MLGLYVIAGAIVVISALAAVFDPNGDRARLAELRRELRRSGHRYAKGSEEEARALRVLLEGDSF